MEPFLFIIVAAILLAMAAGYTYLCPRMDEKEAESPLVGYLSRSFRMLARICIIGAGLSALIAIFRTIEDDLAIARLAVISSVSLSVLTLLFASFARR